MRVVHVVVATFLLASTAPAVLAQAPAAGARPAPAGPPPSGPGEIRGTVTDEAGAPVAHASIAVRSRRDSSLVTGAIAGAEGRFRVQGLRPGAYYLRITSIGFAPRIEDVAVTEAAPTVTVAAKMSRIAVALEGVSVTAEREVVAIEPDRNTYRAKDVAPAAGNAADVLDNVPSVQVDADGKVSLRGNENVAVQINGRPSPIRGTQLGAYLKSLPANIVERVEVIPNPSAKFDPEGMAGIINIVLRQNTDLGMSGGVNVSAANSDRFNASGNLGYQRGRLTSFSSYGYNADGRGVVGINDRERYDALRSLRAVTEQDIEGETSFGGHNFSTTLDYKLSNRDVLSNMLTLGLRNSTDASLSAYAELDGSRTVTDRYLRSRDTDVTGTLLDYNLAFKRTFEPRKHELSSEVRVVRNHEEDGTALWRRPAAEQSSAPTEGELNDTDATTLQYIAQLDYTKSLRPRTKLETGYKGTLRQLERDYRVQKDAEGNGQWVRSGLSNAFSFDETVNAAYAVLSHGVGKFDLQAGLRAEQASRDFSLEQPAATYPYDYGSLFPSGVVLYNATDALQLKASYSRRIRRPGTQELNPFPAFFDVQNVFIGNPRLNPEYTDALEMGLTRSGKLGSLQLSPFYRRTTNVIRVDINPEDVVDGRDVTTVSFRNLATSTSYGSDVNASLRFGKRGNAFASFNVFKMVTDGGSETALSSDAVTWMSRVNGTFNLSPKFVFQGAYFYRAPMKIERGEFAAQQMANLSLRRKLDGDKSSVTLRVVDPFNTMRFKIRAGDEKVIQLTERRFGVRGVFLAYQHTFGQTPRIRQPRPQETEQGGGGFGPPGT